MHQIMAINVSNEYLLSVINDRNSLLICLNQLLTSNERSISGELIDTLFDIHCNHCDSYAKHISLKVLIQLCVDHSIDLSAHNHRWHCLPQMCHFLAQLAATVPMDKCLGFETIVNELCVQLCTSGDHLVSICLKCKNCCICYTPQAVKHLLNLIEDKKLNTILLNLIKEMTKVNQKRCFVIKCMDLLISVVQQMSQNPLIIQTITDCIFGDNFIFIQTIHISHELHAFGGCYSQNGQQLDNEYGCDVVMIRQTILLVLLTMSCEMNLKTNSDEVKANQWQMLEQYARQKSPKFDENNWIIKLFIEEDEQLMMALYSKMSLGDNHVCHQLMKSFIDSIGNDSGVLLDMLCSDEQTATLLLKLLLFYVKLCHMNSNIEMNVRNVLLELRDKMQRLTAKQLFPYNVKPLIKLINKLQT